MLLYIGIYDFSCIYVCTNSFYINMLKKKCLRKIKQKKTPPRYVAFFLNIEYINLYR